jgi:Fic family protein
MTSYQTLAKLYYKDASNNRDANLAAEAARRLDDQSTFRTGIFTSSGEIFLAIPRELTVLHEAILRAERKVSLLSRQLPELARRAFLRSLIMDEIVSTNEIEGVRSTRRQVEQALLSVEALEMAPGVKRFKELARLYLELTSKDRFYPQTAQDIRKIYDLVVAGELKPKDLPDGRLFRKNAVEVVSVTQKAIHSGVLPESAIINMLEQMIELVNQGQLPAVFAAITSHYIFENIHPFYDGNGRTGRYLLALYLSEPLSQTTVLSLSRIIAENKTLYYKAFDQAQNPLNKAEITHFVLQIIKLIRLTQDSLIQTIQDKTNMLDRALVFVNKLASAPHSLSPKAMKIMEVLAQAQIFAAFPEVGIKEISAQTQLGVQTARKYTIALQHKGLISYSTKKPLKFTLSATAEKLLGLDAII